MTQIELILAREILDSRGNPTVEADVILESGARGRAAVPSGASTGEHEAVELRDGDKTRYVGKGVLKAVDNVNEIIAPELEGMDASDQRELDTVMCELDGTPNKSKLGANAILAVSMAASRAMADHLGHRALPVSRRIHRQPAAHANDEHPQRRRPCRQQRRFPGIHGHAGRRAFVREALRWGVETFHTLKGVLKKKGYNTAVGDEGGFAPSLKSNTEAIELMLEAITQAGYKPGEQIAIALDPAASEFYDKDKKKYVFKKSDKSEHSSEDMVKFWADWARQYPIVSLEDGLAENDWEGWKIADQRTRQQDSARRRRYLRDQHR